MRASGFLWLGLLGLVCVAGCSSGGGSGSDEKYGGSLSTQPNAPSSNSDSGGGDEKRIIILTNGNSPFWDACRVGLQEADKELKLKDAGLKAVLEVNDGTPKGQLDKLRQYASVGDVAAVGISALDATNVLLAERLAA